MKSRDNKLFEDIEQAMEQPTIVKSEEGITTIEFEFKGKWFTFYGTSVENAKGRAFHTLEEIYRNRKEK